MGRAAKVVHAYHTRVGAVHYCSPWINSGDMYKWTLKSRIKLMMFQRGLLLEQLLSFRSSWSIYSSGELLGNSSVTDIAFQTICFDFRSLLHMFSKGKYQIIHNNYKAVIMDKAPYEFDAIFLNRFNQISYTMTAVMDITFFGHYFYMVQ